MWLIQASPYFDFSRDASPTERQRWGCSCRMLTLNVEAVTTRRTLSTLLPPVLCSDSLWSFHYSLHLTNRERKTIIEAPWEIRGAGRLCSRRETSQVNRKGLRRETSWFLACWLSVPIPLLAVRTQSIWWATAGGVCVLLLISPNFNLLIKEAALVRRV